MTTTINSVLRNTAHKALVNSVIEQLGYDPSELTEDQDEELQSTLSDIRNHGVDGGFSGFIYYSDTHAFAIANQSAIVALLEEQAESMGSDVVEMVSNFGVFRNSPMDADDKKDLYKYLSGVTPEQGAITNVMAWFAAEEVARMFE